MTVATCLLAGALPAGALPKKEDAIDPTKRAPVSTANAVRPAATPINGNGVVGGRAIPMSEISVRRSSVDGARAPVDVRETRQKDRVIKPSAKANTARSVTITRAVDRPAAIPRINAERFQHLLREYEDNRVPATEMIAGEIRVGDQRVSLADINKFSNPRATLEAQGIPVTTAGSGASAASSSSTVPISREKNGGTSSTTTSSTSAP